ncbi:MAG: outer membrane beta-barrel family protein [Bacteroides sp.]|nr:outer membrane beta-barrel family protein [Bacteroides sp.]MCM1448351.1 outer membrane beta-barrel family protein [Bacteroides sp.]
MERDLKEVTVTASKIRMVVKGDTVVYNADAFQLAEGSMLDGLLKLLPGFELQGGQIKVNGQYVSSLLVNGENFFKGDPRVALENLPGYMVDKVKVYRKEHAYSYITRERSKDDLPLVVDVNLKREYSVGWVANAEVGYGLKERYLGRIFGLRFSDHSRLALYGNANNTNDTREPGTSGEWNAQGVAGGRTEMQTAGLEALVKDKKNIWKYTGNAKFFHRNTDSEQLTSSEIFLAEGSNFTRLGNRSTRKNISATTQHSFDYRKPGGYMTLSASATYEYAKNENDARAATFKTDPMDAYRGASLDSIFMNLGSNRLEHLRLNDARNRGLSRSNVWTAATSLNSYIQVPHTPDYINLSADINVEHRRATAFSDYRLRYAGGTAPDDVRHRYERTPYFSAWGNVSVDYNYRGDALSVEPYLKLSEVYRNTERSLYRLDLLEDDAPEFGRLPSTTEALTRTIDAANTYDERSNQLVMTVGTSAFIWLGGKLPSQSIMIKPEMQWRVDRLDYRRGTLDVSPRRSVVRFTPEVSYGFDDFRVGYSLGYAEPDLLSQQTYTDDVNPLNIFRGNPDLKAGIGHKTYLRRSFRNRKKGSQGSINMYYRLTQRAIAHAMDYDEATGVRTFMPRNVDGNWSTGGSLDYNRTVDKRKQHIFSTSTALDYLNSVDYVTVRSTVRNLSLRETLKLDLRFKDYLVGINSTARYLHATSQRSGFATVNSVDLNYGATAQIPLPGGFSFSTDLTLFHRMGYSDKSMNDVRFVMNARLSTSLLKGRLGFALDGFDIFQGLSNVYRQINAQGLTETWVNSLPSYAMLRVSYKMSKQPKKKFS